MALPSLKSFLAVGALMVAIPLAGAPAALAAAPAESQVVTQKPVGGHAVFASKAIADTASKAVVAAQAGARKGLAEHERRTGEKCTERSLALSVQKEHDRFIGTAVLEATCVKR
ncbi:hypothetical protein [Allokutzneria oryzae]|uniref:UrcA family protein n=1 Tax=Allokutzneria oryzae TaxID=1378989 RepID=A0ABV6A8S9_9PSEU